ncbi:hypothetical protein F5Y08DRAFT_132898 [Xylaria arbuscula]|nr:hypothetical protein F5Y08DRAFT_132898 [Xylaria arbuscula]
MYVVTFVAFIWNLSTYITYFIHYICRIAGLCDSSSRLSADAVLWRAWFFGILLTQWGVPSALSAWSLSAGNNA